MQLFYWLVYFNILPLLLVSFSFSLLFSDLLPFFLHKNGNLMFTELNLALTPAFHIGAEFVM